MKVCFVALHTYPVFNPNAQGVFGGLETHAWTLATELAKRDDYEVSFVVDHPDAKTNEVLDGVRIISKWSRMESIRSNVASHANIFHRPPFVKILKWNFSLLWQIPFLLLSKPWSRLNQNEPTQPSSFYSKIEADLFVCFGVNSVAAEVVASAKSKKTKSMIVLESNSELDENYTKDSEFVSKYGEIGSVCYFAISEADQIVAQTDYQLELLNERFQRTGPVISNPIDVDRWERLSKSNNDLMESQLPNRYVLWIGRSDRFHKRPHLLLQVANSLPEVQFLMILNPNDPEVDQEIRGQCPINIEIITQVPFREMPILFSRADIFMSTGSLDFEGAPNVFQQASASGIPIASLDVGHEWVDESNCGFIADGDMDSLKQTLSKWWNNPEEANRIGKNGLEYVRAECSPAEKVTQLIESFPSK